MDGLHNVSTANIKLEKYMSSMICTFFLSISHDRHYTKKVLIIKELAIGTGSYSAVGTANSPTAQYELVLFSKAKKPTII